MFDFVLLEIVDYVLKFVNIHNPTVNIFSVRILTLTNNNFIFIQMILGTTPFDRETGYLDRDQVKSVWRANNYHDKEKIFIEEADVPTLSPVQSKRVRTTNKYIEFTPTDIYKDIAQTTGKTHTHTKYMIEN